VKAMSTIDVRDLEREPLPPGKFPAEMRSAFRLHLAPEVHQGIEAHAKADPTVEICGVLVGRWGRDEPGPFALVTDYIRCQSASSKLAEVTFTHEAWSEINREMDTKYADKRIVGWYHSHPDFGIFLSDRDSFIHEHFFSGPGQVAYVIDPVRDLEGVFSWQKGKPRPMSYFWVGSEIHTVQASQRSAQREAAARTPTGAERVAADVTAVGGPVMQPALPTAMTLLAWMGLFLLGYGCGDWGTRTEQQMMAEGAVAHYGYTKLMKLGLDQDLAKVRQTLRAIESELRKLPETSAKLSAEEAKKADKHRQVLGDSLLLTERSLEQIQRTYSLSKEEMAVYAQLVAQKQAELKELAMRTGQPAPSAAKATPPATGAATNRNAQATKPESPQTGAAPPSAEQPGSKDTTND